jgi:tetratricopeptide (TPR) repeat protein
MMHPGFARRFLSVPVLLLPLLAACGNGEEAVDARRDLMDQAARTLDEAREKFLRRDEEGGRIDLLRSEELALAALKAPGAPPRIQILNLLANIATEIGLRVRPYLIRAVRLSSRVVDEAPDLNLAYYNLGLCFGAMGHHLEAVRAYERVLESDLPQEIRAAAANNLRGMLLAESRKVVQLGKPGAEAVARRLLSEAYALGVEFGPMPEVEEAIASLGRFYEEATKEAIASGDPIRLAVAHAENGFLVPAKEIVARVKTEAGRTEELRWAEARYLLEIEGTVESLEGAEKLYLEFIGRGERVAHALAGLGRVTLALGRPEDALARIEGFPEPTVELRAVHLEMLFDRLRSLPPGDEAGAGALYGKVDELLLGSFPDDDRRELLLGGLLVAAQRGDADRLSKWVAEFQRRYPTDPGALLYEARLLDLRKMPLLPEDEAPAGVAPAGGKDGND